MLLCEVIMLQCKAIMLFCQNPLIMLKIMLAEFANAYRPPCLKTMSGVTHTEGSCLHNMELCEHYYAIRHPCSD